jgi:hypothetical protein
MVGTYSVKGPGDQREDVFSFCLWGASNEAKGVGVLRAGKTKRKTAGHRFRLVICKLVRIGRLPKIIWRLPACLWESGRDPEFSYECNTSVQRMPNMEAWEPGKWDSMSGKWDCD